MASSTSSAAKELQMYSEKPDNSEHLEQVITEILAEAKRHPIALKRLHKAVARRIEFYRATRVLSVLEKLVAGGKAMVFGNGADPEYFWTGNLDFLKGRVCAILKSHHAKYPFGPGMRAGDIRKMFSETATLNARVNVDARLFELAISACKKDGLIMEADYGMRLAGFTPQSRDDEEIKRLEEDILSLLAGRRYSRIGAEELARELKADSKMVKGVLSGMLKAGKLIRIEDNRYLEPSLVAHVQKALAAEFSRKPQLRISDITALLGLSRTAAIPLLEYFDRIGFTQRNGDFRQMAVRRQTGG
jgi:selenocysteine-specific elongation factor